MVTRYDISSYAINNLNSPTCSELVVWYMMEYSPHPPRAPSIDRRLY